MRSYLFILCSLFAGMAFSQNENVTFQSKTTYTGQTLSNIWGYAAGGKEYALIGAKNGMIVTDVTNPATPVQIVQIAGPSSQWREIKTYQHYAYIATEGGGGLQIVDLSPLPNATLPLFTFTGDGLNSIHALQVDEAKGFLYLYGTNLVGGRARVYDLNQNPTAPVYKGYYNPVGYAHDGYVNNDTMFVGHINAGLVSIVDMTDKVGQNGQIGVTLATPISTPFAFSHNTWRYGNTLFTTDEKAGAPLAAYDISDLNDIRLLDQIKSGSGTNSIVHNTYIRNGYAITSWYVDGFTIVDVNRPSNLVQTGNYDTYTNTGTGFNGAWGVYPFLPSGNILVSNINGTSSTAGEMWVLTPAYVRGCYIEGLVTDAITGNPVSAAVVELVNTTTNTTSNAVGDYKMGKMQSGTYTFKVTKTGYTPFTQTITISNGVLTTVHAALSPNTCNSVVYNSQNFEASWGIWSDGGADCSRLNNATFAKSVPYSIQLRDNTNTSMMSTTNRNLTGYSEITVSFSYITSSFDNSNEDFWLQISTNGGSTYTTVGDYNFGVQFTNGVRQNVSVTIPGPFTSSTRLRFRADASDDDDQVYIDDVVITGCLNTQFSAGDNELATDDVAKKVTGGPESDVYDIKTGPNPVRDLYTVQLMAHSTVQLNYVILDLAGRIMIQDRMLCQEGRNEWHIDVRDLVQGTYIISLQTDRNRYTQKLVVSERP